jgi:tRNA 2-thiocytidine biosynthesis protein TtcA
MTRLEKRIITEIDKANQTWQLFREGEKLLVALSGGKDSLALFHLLQYYPLELQALHIRLSPEHDLSFIENNNLQGEVKVIETSIYDEVKSSGKSLNTCFSCSRQRRRVILEYAEQKGCKKIVFGHHRDDVVATLLLNLFFSREVSTLTPKQSLFKDRFEIIRPLYSVSEKLLVSLQKEQGFKPAKPVCKEAGNSKREYVGDLLAQVQKKHLKIDITDNIYSSLQAVKLSFLPFPPKD